MADNWAAFKTSGNAQNDGNDDDWADFGGFESASPASNPFGDSSGSTAFPWATAFPAASQPQHTPSPSQHTPSQPQHTPSQPQHTPSPAQHKPTPPTNSQPTFPVQTSAFQNSSEQTTNASLLSQPQSTSLFLNDPGEYVTVSGTAQDGVTKQIGSQNNLISQQPPMNATLSSQQSPLGGDGRPSIQQTQQQDKTSAMLNVAPVNDVFISSSKEETMQSAPPIPPRGHQQTGDVARSAVVDEAKLNKVEGELKEANEKVNDYQNKLQVSEENLSLAERERVRLEKSLEEMKKKYSEAADVAKEQYLEIQKQKEKYDQLEEQHEEQLKKLREAGQESFALIVEEYKELSKTAVAQEREINEKHMQRLLEEEREKFTTFVNQQGENLKLLVKEEQASNLKKLEEALEEQKTKHQTDLKECLEEERQRAKEALEKSVEEERVRGKTSTEELLDIQKKEFENFIAEQKKIFEENLVQERKETAKLIEEILKKEQERARNSLDEAMAEERQKSRDTVNVVKEKTREEMEQYIKDKEKGVQTQLRSLMNNSDSSPSS